MTILRNILKILIIHCFADSTWSFTMFNIFFIWNMTTFLMHEGKMLDFSGGSDHEMFEKLQNLTNGR